MTKGLFEKCRRKVSSSSLLISLKTMAFCSVLLLTPSPAIIGGGKNFVFVSALKCKCTQNSPKTPCVNGACDVPNDSACLMLDHPSSGRHYACSMAKLKEGDCTEKTTKTGASVQVCSCNSSDFCNFKLWPKQSDDLDDEDEWVPVPANNKDSQTQQRARDELANGSTNSRSFSLAASTMVVATAAIYAFLAL